MSDRDGEPTADADLNANAETSDPNGGVQGWVSVFVGLGLVIAACIALLPFLVFIGVLSAPAAQEVFAAFWPEVFVLVLVGASVGWAIGTAVERLTTETTEQREDR